MTVAVGVVVPGKGAVIAAESRITAGDHILTDASVKVRRQGEVTFAEAGGHDVWEWVVKCTTWAALKRRAQRVGAASNDWALLVFDGVAGRLLYLDNNLHFPVGPRHAIGVGSPYALGVLDAAGPARTLEQAEAIAQAAVEAAIRRNVHCGGPILTIRHPLR